jgi:hypothetical protein
MHMFAPACATVILGCTFVGNGPAFDKLIGGPAIFSLHLIVPSGPDFKCLELGATRSTLSQLRKWQPQRDPTPQPPHDGISIEQTLWARCISETLIYLFQGNNVCTSQSTRPQGSLRNVANFRGPPSYAFPLPHPSNRSIQQGVANLVLPLSRQPSAQTELNAFNLIVRSAPCH